MNGLVSYRDKLNMSQSEFAAMLGVSQDKISRYEQSDPEDIPLSFFKNMAEKLGTSLQEILEKIGVEEVETAKGSKLDIDYDNHWKKVEQSKNRLLKYIDGNMDKSFNEYYPRAEELKEQCKSIVENGTRKKRIAVVGHYSSGKSTLINSVLGTDKLPMAWGPTTSTAVFLRHVSDKPEYLSSSENVLVYKMTEEKVFTVLDVYEEKEPDADLCIRGDYSLLKEYGARAEDATVNSDVAGIIVYLDSDILKSVDFVDLPGYGTEEKLDDDLTTIMSAHMDALIYMSSSNQFLMGDEIAYLRNTIKTLPAFEHKGQNEVKPLGNLFIVASQAHFIPNKDDLDKQIENGAQRFVNSIPTSIKEYFEGRSKTTGYDTEEFFVERFFSYTTNRKDRSEKFELDLKDFIEKIADASLKEVDTYLNQFVDSNCKTISADLDNYRKLRENLEEQEKEYTNIILREPERIKKVRESEENVYSAISKYSTSSKEDFEEVYDSIINVDHIVSVIKEKNLKRRKDDIRLLADYLTAELEDKLNVTLSEYSNKLQFDIEKYLSDFETVSVKDSVNASMFAAFDVRRAFASGLTGLAALGALSFWASSFGSLGGYILVAKGVSILSMLGISISGGTATAMAAVASIGGPIVLGIAIAVLAAILAFGIFSGGWQKEIAKNIIKAFGKQKYGPDSNKNAIELYEDVISDFWNKTKDAFSKAANETENQWIKSLEMMRDMIEKSKCDPEFDKKRDSVAEKVRNFLLKIPNIVFNEID